MLLVGALGVVAQGADPPGDLVPGEGEVGERLVDERLARCGDTDAGVGARVGSEVGRGLAEEVGQIAETVVGEHGQGCGHPLVPYAEQHPEFLGEQCAYGRGAITGRGEAGEVNARTGAARERHLAQGGPQAAVGSVVVGDQKALVPQRIDRVDECDQTRWVVEIGDVGTESTLGLGEDRPTDPVPTGAEVDKKEGAVRGQGGGQGAADVAQGREGRHHERDRGRDLTALPARRVGPLGPHGQGVLADGHADP